MDSIDITKRFLEALDTLKKEGAIHGVSVFTTKYNIDRRNLYKLYKQPERDILKPWWLTALVADYGISAKWLLTGKGSMHDKA